MKITNEGYQTESSTNFESTKFRIGNVEKIIDLLISQYKYPIRTLVQEYISNGLDATKEAGHNQRLEVQLPNRLNNNVFSVRDYGVGLTPDRVQNVFTVMGNTTKSMSNEQIGGFGLGAKSALSYTSSFIVKTIVDKVLYHYVIRKGDTGGIVLNKILEQDSDQENGTIIEISCKNGDENKFRKAFYRCTMFWDKDDLPHINELPEDKFELLEGLKLSDELTVFKETDFNDMIDMSYNDQIVFTLGGIPYLIDHYQLKEFDDYSEVIGQLRNGTNLLIELPVGTVMPIQTREALNFESNLTQMGITEALRRTRFRLEKYLKDEIWLTNNLYDRIKEIKELKDTFNITSEDFKGFNLTEYGNSISWRNKPKSPSIVLNHRNSARGYGKTKVVKRDVMEFIRFDSIDRLYYKDVSESSVMTNRRIKKELESNSSDIYLLSKGGLTNKRYAKLIQELKVKRISELELPEVELTAKKKRVKRVVSTVCVHRPKYSYWKKSNPNALDSEWVHLDSTETILYLDKDKMRTIPKGTYTFFEDNGMLIRGISKTHLKHCKDNKNFKEYYSFVKDYKLSKDAISKLGKDTFRDRLERPELYYFMRDNVKDIQWGLSKLISCVNISKDDVRNNYSEYYFEGAIKENVDKQMEEFNNNINLFNTITKNYPLLSDINYRGDAAIDAVNYLNSKEIK